MAISCSVVTAEHFQKDRHGHDCSVVTVELFHKDRHGHDCSVVTGTVEHFHKDTDMAQSKLRNIFKKATVRTWLSCNYLTFSQRQTWAMLSCYRRKFSQRNQHGSPGSVVSSEHFHKETNLVVALPRNIFYKEI